MGIFWMRASVDWCQELDCSKMVDNRQLWMALRASFGNFAITSWRLTNLHA